MVCLASWHLESKTLPLPGDRLPTEICGGRTIASGVVQKPDSDHSLHQAKEDSPGSVGHRIES